MRGLPPVLMQVDSLQFSVELCLIIEQHTGEESVKIMTYNSLLSYVGERCPRWRSALAI